MEIFNQCYSGQANILIVALSSPEFVHFMFVATAFIEELSLVPGDLVFIIILFFQAPRAVRVGGSIQGPAHGAQEPP